MSDADEYRRKALDLYRAAATLEDAACDEHNFQTTPMGDWAGSQNRVAGFLRAKAERYEQLSKECGK